MNEDPVEPPRTGSSFINRIVALSLEQRILVAFLTVLLIAAGVRAWARLPVDAYPDLSPPMVSITAQWPGHSAEEVERLITVPIEREMNGFRKENNLRSVSLYALSAVDITFDQDTDRNFARQQVFNRLADIGLPSGVTPDVAPLTSPSGLIYRYTLQSPDRSPTEFKTFEDWVVEPQFRSVAGVADDSGFGGGTMQYQVLLDQYRLAGAGLSPQQVETRSARTTAMAAADSIRRAGNSTTSAASAGSRPWTTSATSSSPCTTASRRSSRTSRR